MMFTVIKRNGATVPFDRFKIRNAIIAAWISIDVPDIDEVDFIVNEITTILCVDNRGVELQIDTIENVVLSVLYRRLPKVAQAYSSYKTYRNNKKLNPSETDEVLQNLKKVAGENANKNNELAHIKNAYLAEIPSRQAMREALPAECLEAHDAGIVYFHDMAYSFRPITNCELLNLEECFKGCEINSVWIDTPKSFRTMCTVTSQILSHVASNTYGGCTINLLHLAKFVDVSRKKIQNKFKRYPISSETYEQIVSDELNQEIHDGIQTLAYQCQTLCASVGQAVFLTVSCYLNEDIEYVDDLILVFKELLQQRITGMPNEQGMYENPNFPKILYALDEDTLKGGKYYEITKLCAECTSKRLVPDYMSVAKHLEIKGVYTPSMGCRALLSPYKDENGNYVTWGRFNIGVQTLNLPYIAMLDNPDKSIEVFYKNLKKYLNIAYRDLLWRVNHCAKIKSDVCPILWQHGGLARLKHGEDLSSLIYGGYATVTIGYSGLYECIKYLTGENHYDAGIGEDLAVDILEYINEHNKELGDKINVSIALYATPQETLTDKFANACINKFGHVGDGTQRHYLTNGYHIPVFEKVDAFTKLTKEAKFSDLTAGGSISYVELPNMVNNQEGLLSVINHIGHTSLYGEINSEISICGTCKFAGYDFPKKYASDGTIRWVCPCCGESDPFKVRTSYRICGYISNYTPNQGRSEDIMNRVKHLNFNEETTE